VCLFFNIQQIGEKLRMPVHFFSGHPKGVAKAPIANQSIMFFAKQPGPAGIAALEPGERHVEQK